VSRKFFPEDYFTIIFEALLDKNYEAIFHLSNLAKKGQILKELGEGKRQEKKSILMPIEISTFQHLAMLNRRIIIND